jgi:hypothetical protein
MLDPKKSPDLPKYLARKKLTLQDFEAMIAGNYQPPEVSVKAPAPITRKIEKIQTGQGLILSTRGLCYRTFMAVIYGWT